MKNQLTIKTKTMKNHTKLFSKAILAICLFCIISLSASAQTCSVTYKSKIGKVYSANPAIIRANSTSDEVTISVTKTNGRAETQVNIYVDGVYKDKIEFDNGRNNYSTALSKTVTGALNKQVKVEIVNQSAAYTFSYNLKINGNSQFITTTGGAVTGTLLGQVKKTIYTNSSCTNKTRIIIRRTVVGKGSNARGTIRVYEKQGNGWASNTIKSFTFEPNETKKIFVVNSNRQLKVDLKNISAGNKLKYKMNAVVAN